MVQSIVNISLLVKDYDEAIAFFTHTLHFQLIEDNPVPEQNKRWVVIAPKNSRVTRITIAKASTPEQEKCIGSQTGGRVFLSLSTDDFWRGYENMRQAGIVFVREPKKEIYGTVAVWKDLYGNLWDLIQYKNQ